MKRAIIIHAVNVIFLSCVLRSALSKESETYGEYEICLKNTHKCKDYRPGKAGSMDITFQRDRKQVQVIHINATIFEDDGPLQQKIELARLKRNKYEKFMNWNTDFPCGNVKLIKVLLGNFIQFDSLQNCTIKKGNKVHILNPTELAHGYIGKTFFYGDYRYTLSLYTNMGSISCIVVYLSFSKTGSCK